MQLKIYKRIYLTPFIRLNITNRGVSLSFGHRSVGWITLGKRGLRETIDTPISGVYLSETQSWKKLRRK